MTSPAGGSVVAWRWRADPRLDWNLMNRKPAVAGQDGYDVQGLVPEALLIAAESERDALQAERLLMEHKVITCGVAANFPDMSSAGEYGKKWDSPQAQDVRKLRAKHDALAAGVRALADELAAEAAAITDDAHQMDHAIGLALVTFIDRLRALLAGDGEHNTGEGGR